MSAAELGLALAVFLASAVECVEALTIVLAVGSARGWSSALGGAGAGLLALAVLVLAAGAGLRELPLDPLRVLVGLLLVLVGLQWLRKAVLRQAGRRALRDERAVFDREISAARLAGAGRGFDGYAFAVAGKGVLLEGLEVVLIVVTLGADRHRTGLAAASALLAAACVVLAGLAVRAPLARVPENTMKLAVGIMLSAYGLFWVGEGAGLGWPGGEAMLLALVALVLLAALLAVASLRRTAERGRQP